MFFKEIRTIAVVVAGALVPVVSAPAKAVSTDAEVQMLANFPALQRLAAKGDAKDIRRYLARVASAYRRAGYDSVGGALPKMDVVIEILEPGGEPTESDRRKARAALRRLDSALASDNQITLPVKSGERVPNYYGLAATFSTNAGRALKNLAQGKSISNFLRRKTETSWVLNLGGDEFAVTKGDLATKFSASISKTGSGTLAVTTGAVFLSGNGTTYAGGTLVTGGTLVVNPGGNLGSNFTIRPGSHLILKGDEHFHWIAFPPGVEVPADWSDLGAATIFGAITDGTITYPAGTKLVRAPVERPLPEGALELPNPATLQSETASILGSGTFATPTPTPTPSPTPAE